MLLTGAIIQCRYLIVREIRKGTSGAVYLAVDTQAGARFFIKELEKDLCPDQLHTQQELFKELELLKQLHSAYAPEIVEILETDDSYLLCMDYVEGESLEAVIQAQGTVSQTDAVKWCMQLCDVLHKFYAQPHRSLHCDLHPANILRKRDGAIILIGYDLACCAGGEEQTDVLAFAAPAQLNDGIPDVRADIYTLGALLCYLVTGRSPGLPTPKAKLMGEPDSAYVGTPIGKVVWKCCQAKPEKRYRDVASLRRALQNLYRKCISQAAKQYARRRNWGLTVMAACLIVMLAVLVALIRAKLPVHWKLIGSIAICVVTAFVERRMVSYLVKQLETPRTKAKKTPVHADEQDTLRQNDFDTELSKPEHGEHKPQPESSGKELLNAASEQATNTSDHTQYLDSNDCVGKTAPLSQYENRPRIHFEVTEKMVFTHTDVLI